MKLNTSEILGNLNGEKSYLINLNPEELQKDIIDIIDFLVKKRGWNCVYLSANKSYSMLKKNLEKKGFNLKKFFFIDASGGDGGASKEKIANLVSIPSASALTQIEMAITQMIQLTQGQGFLIVDTVEGLLINNKPEILANFIRSVIKKSTKYDSKTIVLTGGGVEKKFINIISTFFEKTIKKEDFKTREKNLLPKVK